MNFLERLRGAPYPYRNNSLNMFRLFLAACVLFAHAWYIAGEGVGPQLHGENVGGWAVAGFFVISGFLITRSRIRTRAGEYLLHRVARIYPAFVVCLFVTALVFGPIAMMIEHGSLAGYVGTPVTPAQYVWGNLGLSVTSYDIGRTLDTVPYPNAWNGSLWTLYFEFLCYLFVWIAGAWSAFRRSWIPAAVLWMLSTIVWSNIDLANRLGLDMNFILLSKLLPFFLGGTLVYFLVDRWGINRGLGIVSLLIASIIVVMVPGWGGQAAAPFMAYGLLFLATLIPQPRWIARNDVSYGFYIYAWPVQQLVVLFGGLAWGMPVYILLTIIGAVALAIASWFLVERPAMNRVRGRVRRGDAVRAPSV